MSKGGSGVTGLSSNVDQTRIPCNNKFVLNPVKIMKIQAQALILGVTSVIALNVKVAPSYAVNLIGNLPSNDVSSTGLSSSSGTNVKAVSFTLPTGTDYILNNVILRLGSYGASDVFNVQIRNDTGDANPGPTILANLTLPGSQGDANFDYTFTPATAFTFLQNTKYWLYVDISSGSGGSGSIVWRASSPAVPPAGIATYGAYRFSNNGGTSFGNSSVLNSFQINATEATLFPLSPMPCPLWLVGFCLGLGYGQRKNSLKRKSTA